MHAEVTGRGDRAALEDRDLTAERRGHRRRFTRNIVDALA
jgi:hypothetical protein